MEPRPGRSRRLRSSRQRGVHRCRRAHWLRFLVVTAPVVAVAAICVAAWSRSPAAVGLEQRVRLRLDVTGGTAAAPGAIAPALREAVVATEDERFYHHPGIDLIGILRALPDDLTHLSFRQGASTITEQVAKLLYLNGNDHSPWRKLVDASIALKLERRYSKEQILAAYLNSVYFGDDAYGVKAASMRYFAVTPGKVNLAQASLLAGLIQAPSAYDPFRHPEAARSRQLDVLSALVRDGFANADEAGAVLRRPLRLRGGLILPPVKGADLAPAAPFIWWQLAIGALMTLLAVVAFLGSRLPRFRLAHGALAVRLSALCLVLAGVGIVFRSFRAA